MKSDKIVEQGIQNLMGAICGTIVVADEGWGDTIPDWLKGQIRIERLIECMKPDTHMCTDAEATAYLYTMSLRAPMKEDACLIYFYLVKKYMKQQGGSLPPSVPAPDKLTSEQEKTLDDLKRWIYKQRSQREKKRFVKSNKSVWGTKEA